MLLSSHILAEVEQVCTHVAVLDRGRLVRSGSVAELLRLATSVYIEVDDVEAAMRLLGGFEGVRSAVREPPGIAVELAGMERRALVAALVRADIGVETVTSRQHLEEAFFEVLRGEA